MFYWSSVFVRSVLISALFSFNALNTSSILALTSYFFCFPPYPYTKRFKFISPASLFVFASVCLSICLSPSLSSLQVMFLHYCRTMTRNQRFKRLILKMYLGYGYTSVFTLPCTYGWKRIKFSTQAAMKLVTRT